LLDHRVVDLVAAQQGAQTVHIKLRSGRFAMADLVYRHVGKQVDCLIVEDRDSAAQAGVETEYDHRNVAIARSISMMVS
jgi:hypothetical protein